MRLRYEIHNQHAVSPRRMLAPGSRIVAIHLRDHYFPGFVIYRGDNTKYRVDAAAALEPYEHKINQQADEIIRLHNLTITIEEPRQ